jgi:BCD family chlorophyll transporter-like MFS transporter
MTLGWGQIVRLGLVQASLGSIVVLTTSTLNRLMVVELALPAVLPGLLVALHYAIQITRPNWGFLSDAGGRRTRFIIGGMALLGLGAFLAALAVTLFPASYAAGLALSVLAYVLIGLGVGASGTSLLALLATATAPERRAGAAMITWLMMIAGIAITAVSVGHALDPYTPARLLAVVATVAVAAVAVTSLAVGRIERGVAAQAEPAAGGFRAALAEVWGEPKARAFTIFVFLSMTAYSMQELILEPYAGLVFGLTPGQSTALGGPQNGGAFIGMVLVGVAVSFLRVGSLRGWVTLGCAGSAAALVALAAIGQGGDPAVLVPVVAAVGFFNGMFAVAAIGSMMALAGTAGGDGRAGREGTRMGLWGAAQAIGFGGGSLFGAAAVDAMRAGLPAPQAFGTVFLIEAALFCAAAVMAARILGGLRAVRDPRLVPGE